MDFKAPLVAVGATAALPPETGDALDKALAGLIVLAATIVGEFLTRWWHKRRK